MRKFMMLAGFLLLFALAWAAGHDILSGERDVWMEYTVIAASLLLAGFRLNVETKKLIGQLKNR